MLPGVIVAEWLGCRTFDKAVVGSIHGRGAINVPRSTPSFHPSGVGKSSTSLSGWAGVKAGCARLCRAASKIV